MGQLSLATIFSPLLYKGENGILSRMSREVNKNRHDCTEDTIGRMLVEMIELYNRAIEP